MKISIFCHSLISDHNFSSAHFLRGIASELSQKHEVRVFEKENNSSFNSAIKEFGKVAVNEFFRYYPKLKPQGYIPSFAALSDAVKDIDFVLVHSSADPITLGTLAELKKQYSYKLWFYDSTGVVFSDPDSLRESYISSFDGVLVSGNSLKDKYISEQIHTNVWLLREGVDLNIFHPRKASKDGTVIINADWVNDETGDLISEFFIKPVRDLRVNAKIYGVNYPKSFKKMLEGSEIEYCGWLPSYKIPEMFSRFTTAIYIPDQNHEEKLPGVPSIKILETLSCGIPLLSAPWNDSEKLFSVGRDFLAAKDGYEMKHFILEMMNSTLCEVVASHGQKTINSKHTCKQRVEELERIIREVGFSKSITNNSKLVVNG